MKPDRPSDTAEMVCSWRALEGLLPPGDRILDDPYARAFLGAGRAQVVDAAERLPAGAVRVLLRQVDRLLQGAMTFVLARHRAIDDLLVERRARQVVLLGAGYDSRAVRLAGVLGDATLFEVDHPATAARRAELAPAAFGDAPRARTVSVAIDFQRESLEERLLAAGLAPDRATVWVWEGVCMYLDEAAVRQTLDIVGRRSPPGSLLAFDVWCPPAAGLPRLTRRDLPSLAFRLLYGEPLTWGPRQQDLDPLLREHGLALIDAVPSPDLVGRYAPKRRSVLGVGTSMVFAVAEVDRPVT